MSARKTASPAEEWPAGLSAPARRALAAAGLTRLAQLARVSEAELLKLHGLGPKSIPLLKAALAERGLSLAAAADSRRINEPANRRIPRRPAGRGR